MVGRDGVKVPQVRVSVTCIAETIAMRPLETQMERSTIVQALAKCHLSSKTHDFMSYSSTFTP